jgi:histidyl-tRNA synthetase
MAEETVKGFRDYIGEEAEKRQVIKGILAETFLRYGFQLAETPIVEYEEFVRGGNENDEAVSDTYKLQDKGNRKLALRYEFTFQLKRISKNQKLPYKRFQIGEVFRDEPTSSARFRQFTQCDIDTIGSSVRDEAEILSIASEVLEKLNIKNTINVGNRKLLNEILGEQKIKEKDKSQVLREIDKLDKLSEKEVRANLKKFGADKLLSVLSQPESFFRKYNAYKEIEELKKFCKYYNVKINFQPSLVRGLSYYNGNVWEIKTKDKDMGETICGGGSYMVNGIQATGTAFGVERLTMLAKREEKKPRVLIISIGEDGKAIKVAEKLRKKGDYVTIFYGKPTKALEYANSRNIEQVIFIGEEEAKKGKYKVRDMKTGKEKWEGM